MTRLTYESQPRCGDCVWHEEQNLVPDIYLCTCRDAEHFGHYLACRHPACLFFKLADGGLATAPPAGGEQP